jgi:hypothetical protein
MPESIDPTFNQDARPRIMFSLMGGWGPMPLLSGPVCVSADEDVLPGLCRVMGVTLGMGNSGRIHVFFETGITTTTAKDRSKKGKQK